MIPAVVRAADYAFNGGDIHMKDTVLIGLCGRSGSGKSFVSSVFSSFGGYHIDTDAVYHDLLLPREGELSECARAIASEFGDSVVADGTIARRALSNIVFSDRERLLTLNKIAHAYILKETLSVASECGAPFAVIDAPVLFESGFDKLCSFTVCVAADDETCIYRICRRDGVSREDAIRRLSNQIPQETLVSMCDYSIDNSLKRDVVPDVKKILAEEGLL